MKKKIFSLFLAVVMVLLLIPVIAVPAVADAPTPGTPTSIAYAYGIFYKSTLSDGKLTRLNEDNPLRPDRYWTQLYDGIVGAGVSVYGTSAYTPSIYFDTDSNEFVQATATETTRGVYHGLVKITLNGKSSLTSFSILSSMDDGDFTSGWTNNAFDIYYSEDGNHWTFARSFTGMSGTDASALTAEGKWEYIGTTGTAKNTALYAATTTFDNVIAGYITIAVKEGITGNANKYVYFEEATVTGTVISSAAPAVSITDGSFLGYKGFLTANDGQERYKQRGYNITLDVEQPIEYAYDGDTTTYAGGTGGVGGYYPELYLDESGELKKDKTYDGVNENVNFNTYAANNPDNYYGVFKFELGSLVSLDQVTIYAGFNSGGKDVDSDKAFDILYSIDGTHWKLGASCTNMTKKIAWTELSSDLATLHVSMGGVSAKYIMVGMSIRSGQYNSSLWLFEVAASGNAPSTIEVTYESELRTAVTLCGSSATTTIRLAADIIMSSQSSLGGIAGTLDGGNHTIYNFQSGAYFCYPLHNCIIENLTFSDLTEPGGSSFTMANGQKTLFGTNATSSEIMAGETSIIRNVTNNRSLLGSGNTNGAFFATLTIAGTVRFENCVNNGDYLQNGGSGSANQNHKIGGFVGSMATGTVEFVNCVNNGDITASQAGGFVGVYAAGTTITLTGCTNTGDITGLANGTAYGVAGGLIGGFNNTGTVGANTTITITGCTNTGDIKVKYTADSSKDCAAGGFIGHAGGTDSDIYYTITIDDSAVYNCAIDAVGDNTEFGNTESSKEYAGSFLGKVSPRGSHDTIVAKNSYISNVTVRADHARAFIGVGSYVTTAEAINLVAVNLNERDVETGEVKESWNGSRNSGCTRSYSASESFTQTDANRITGGAAGFLQHNGDQANGVMPSKVRFASTLGEDLSDLELAGYQIIATYTDSEGTKTRGWTISSKFVFASLKENLTPGSAPSVKTASQIHSGDSWIFALTVENIPGYIGDVTFYATPFIVKSNGTILFGKRGSATISFGEANDTEIKLMSYNVKDGAYGTGDQSPNQRKTGLAKTIALKNPEIVCLQECNALSASTLAAACKSNGTRTYTVYQPAGRTTALMYDATLYTALATGYADLTVPVADGGDGYTRTGVWAKLKRIEDNAVFYVVSAHFDLEKPGTSADKLIDYINENFQGVPTIIMGDLNANEARWVNIAQMKNAGYSNANTDYTTFLTTNNIKGYGDYTWTTRVGETTAADNGLNPTFSKSGWIIDWCYYTKNVLTSANYETVTSTVSWSYSYESSSFPSSGSCTANPSDHYPIYVEVAFN